MPKSRAVKKEKIVSDAMTAFWHRGYAAMSMDQIVKATGANRQAIYSDFGGKHALFLACMATYQSEVVTPAFASVEAEGAKLEALEDYYEFQVSRGEEMGLPGPGCLVSNTMTELAPHDEDAMALVNAHNQRLFNGFLNVLDNCNAKSGLKTQAELEELARFLLVSTQGLWAMSRAVSDARPLRSYARMLVYVVEAELNR